MITCLFHFVVIILNATCRTSGARRHVLPCDYSHLKGLMCNVVILNEDIIKATSHFYFFVRNQVSLVWTRWIILCPVDRKTHSTGDVTSPCSSLSSLPSVLSWRETGSLILLVPYGSIHPLMFSLHLAFHAPLSWSNKKMGCIHVTVHARQTWPLGRMPRHRARYGYSLMVSEWEKT